MIAAARWAAAGGSSRIRRSCARLRSRRRVPELLDEVDRFFCPHVRDDLYAIGTWYADFSQVSDDDVQRLLDGAAAYEAAVRSVSSP